MQKVLLVDDLENDLAADETLTFVLDDQAYVIDLSAQNAKAFREAVEPYRTVARRLGKHKVREAPPMKAASQRSEKKKPSIVSAEWYKALPSDSAAVKAKRQKYRQRVRAWATEHGHLRSKRGTIPREVYRAYEEWAEENGVPTGPASVGL